MRSAWMVSGMCIEVRLDGIEDAYEVLLDGIEDA